MTDPAAGDDVPDVTGQVTAVTARSPLLEGVSWTGYTNGKSFFFTDPQVDRMSGLLSGGQVRRRSGGGWEEVIPGKGLRFLAERHIDGVLHYRFRKHWKFTVPTETSVPLPREPVGDTAFADAPTAP